MTSIALSRRDSYHSKKRLFDIVTAVVLLIVFAPLMAIVAVAILATAGRPVIFWQRRVGLDGHDFWCPKFRSMHSIASVRGTSLDVVPTPKVKNDPRLFAVGRVIRKLSIDELPQLWCVLEGQMSMVGPRPPLPSEVAEYSEAARRRLEVKPGITCLWQISGRSELSFERQLELDLSYIEKQSLWLDLKVLLLTIPAVLSCRGAY